MKRIVAAFVFLLLILYSNAQRVQVIVPKQVVTGNAFQIQYVVDDPSSFETITAPRFENLRLVSGPNYYKGNSQVKGKTQPIENITYTVVPLKTGNIKIEPALVKFKNGKDETTNEVMVTAIPQPKASFNALSTYTDINLYAPSSKSDLDKLIEDNLFIKTEVDKRICFLGEAITATFKLYSRLQSTSEVINAPSLYGFSVMDVLNINEAHQAVETINGRVFNTSVLRKLQLYPTQTGKLNIDEMELENSIEFDDSSTGRKMKVEKILASNPIEITVKPLSSPQPEGYSGAVGQFSVNIDLADKRVEANKQGKLIFIVDGEGNFIQFGPPSVQWPKGFDVFDPLVEDELDKSSSPTKGRRKYIFNFTTNNTGVFIIPPVSFSFFDPSSRKYKEVKSDSLQLEILQSPQDKETMERKIETPSSTKKWIYGSVILILALIAFFLLRRRKRVTEPGTVKPNYIEKFNEIVALQLSGKAFCFEIQKLSKEITKDSNLSFEQNQELEAIQKDCQLLIYADVDSEIKTQELNKRIQNFLRELDPGHSAYL